MKSFTSLVSIVLLGTTSAYGWGFRGHQTVGYIAMEFLTPKAKRVVESSLGPTYNHSLGVAATWADEIKSDPAYHWSSELHFVDALDNPPTSCTVDQQRDCANGRCILGAIANYTARAVNKHLPSDQQQEALKFLAHFVGDLAQPLHVENIAAGGNGISVVCNGTTSNLHAVWDSGLVDRLVAENYDNSVTTWAASLVKRIKIGTYKHSAYSWISCSSTTATLGSHDSSDPAAIEPLKCPLVWARESNSFDCSYVFDFTSEQDLCLSDYFTNAVPIIEEQIAKHGIRLATWLNHLFDGKAKWD